MTTDKIQMTTAPHLMIDIETLGVQVNAPIFAVGAAIFDINTGVVYEEFYKLIDFSYADNNHLFSYSASTVAWWVQQNPEVCKEMARALVEGLEISSALVELMNFINKSEAIKYWAKGQFDLPILSYHYSVILKQALDFRKFSDMRTTLAEAEINPKMYPSVGNSHNALDDCKHQILCLRDAWGRVREWRNSNKKDYVSAGLLTDMG